MDRRAVACLLIATACAAPQGTRVTPTELRAMEMREAAARQQAAAEAEVGGAPEPSPGVSGAMAPRSNLSPEQAKKRDEFDKRRTDIERRREDQARGAFELEQRRRRTLLEQESAVAQEAVALEAADRERRQAAEDLQRWRAEERPRREAEDALDLQVSADNLLETAEELKQLEMMYSTSELGDATAEIVLNRSRRRLQRAEERHHLRERRSDELRTVTLPREEASRLATDRAKAVALDNVRRTQDKERLAREAALRDLDFEARKLEREATDVARDQGVLERELASWTRELSLTGETASAGAP